MILGFSLLSVRWIISGQITGFFLMLFMICTFLLRLRIPSLKWTVIADGLLCVFISPWALLIVMFSGMYYRFYFMVILVLIFFDIYIASLALLAGLGGLFLGFWEKERERGLEKRDTEAGKYYELETLQGELLAATAKIEQMSVVSERARIAREIHDNAGHEIVAAYMSLQTAREILNAPDDVLGLYDAALDRLDKGVNKIREAVHNLAPVAMLSVDALREICERFPRDGVSFKVFGDTSNVPVHVWGVLEACLNEALTNTTRHAHATYVKVNLDTTPHIVRLLIENDGVLSNHTKPAGKGLRNLRQRATSVGGSLAVDSNKIFRIICVIPIKGDVLI